MSNKEIDLFSILKAIDKNDIEYYRNLSVEDKKKFVPLLTLRWMSGTSDKTKIQYLNSLMNQKVFPLHAHPELLYYGFLVCSNGKYSRYNWIKKKKKEGNKPETVRLLKEYNSMSTREAKDCVHLITKEDAVQMAESLGYQKDAITKLKKEFSGK
jgi:hypothetical protein